ncbi:hypothetical protein ABK040_001789 [Willaertia magna]
MNSVNEQQIKEKLQQLIKDAKIYAKKAEQLLLEAKRKEQEYGLLCSRYSGTQQKLQILFSEIQKQLGVVKRLVLTLRHKNKILLSDISQYKTFQETSLMELGQVLETLKRKALHSQLSISQGKQQLLRSTEKKSLFDFVNIESVTQLQQQACTELKRITLIERKGNEILQDVDLQFDDVQRNSELLMNLTGKTDSITTSTNDEQMVQSSNDNSPQLNINFLQNLTENAISDDMNLNQQDIFSMTNIVLEIAGHNDRLQHLLNPVFYSSIDFDDLEQKNNNLRNYISKLENHFEIITNNYYNVNQKYQKFSEFYRLSITCYKQLEQLSPTIPQKVVELDELQTTFHQHKMDSLSTFEEIRELTVWYTFFVTSYDKMLLEIDRRRKVIKQTQEIIDEFRQKIDQIYIEEEQKRQQFFKDYGEYLPGSLCPSILESTVKFQIVPEKWTSNLPELSLTDSLIQQLEMSTSSMQTTQVFEQEKSQEEEENHEDDNSPQH